MNADDIKTLRKLLRQLATMVERQPSLVVSPAWQKATEGIARLLIDHTEFQPQPETKSPIKP